MIGALAFGAALLLALVAGCVVFWKEHAQQNSQVAQDGLAPVPNGAGGKGGDPDGKASPGRQPPPPHEHGNGNRPDKGPRELNVSGKRRVDGKNGAGGDAKKADTENQAPKRNEVPEQKQRALTCANLWEKEKKRAVRGGEKVIVTGTVAQDGLRIGVNAAAARMWRVEEELPFVGLSDTGKDPTRVICVFPDPRMVPVLEKGEGYRFEGTYRGRRGAGGAHEVLLLTECKVVQQP
jgi:hypothetical protein